MFDVSCIFIIFKKELEVEILNYVKPIICLTVKFLGTCDEFTIIDSQKTMHYHDFLRDLF